jgi:Flp pilus assembly pilin Flp
MLTQISPTKTLRAGRTAAVYGLCAVLVAVLMIAALKLTGADVTVIVTGTPSGL